MPSIAIESSPGRRIPGSQIHVSELLRRSPVYTDDCDLYPRRMREVLNQQMRVIVSSSSARTDQQSDQANASVNRRIMSRADIEALLELYPAAARHLQLQMYS